MKLHRKKQAENSSVFRQFWKLNWHRVTHFESMSVIWHGFIFHKRWNIDSFSMWNFNVESMENRRRCAHWEVKRVERVFKTQPKKVIRGYLEVLVKGYIFVWNISFPPSRHRTLLSFHFISLNLFSFGLTNSYSKITNKYQLKNIKLA